MTGETLCVSFAFSDEVEDEARDGSTEAWIEEKRREGKKGTMKTWAEAMNNVTNAKKNRRPEVSFKEKDAGERWVGLTRETQDTSWTKWRQTWGLVARTPRPRRTRKTDVAVRRLEIELPTGGRARSQPRRGRRGQTPKS